MKSFKVVFPYLWVWKYNPKAALNFLGDNKNIIYFKQAEPLL